MVGNWFCCAGFKTEGHAFHYLYLTKHLVKKKVARAVDIEMRNVTPPVNNVPGVLVIPALL